MTFSKRLLDRPCIHHLSTNIANYVVLAGQYRLPVRHHIRLCISGPRGDVQDPDLGYHGLELEAKQALIIV